jgi:hypothetical protein
MYNRRMTRLAKHTSRTVLPAIVLAVLAHASSAQAPPNRFKQVVQPYVDAQMSLHLHTLNTESYYLVAWVEFHLCFNVAFAQRKMKISGTQIHFCDFESRKSLIIGTIVDMRFISVTCVVSGNMANLDAERSPRSPEIPPPFRLNISEM